MPFFNDYTDQPENTQQRGFNGWLSDRLDNPLVSLGLALAGGTTPQEGLANAANALQVRQRLAQANLTSDIKEYQYDMAQRVASGEDRIPFGEWRKQNNAINERTGMNPLFDEQGNLRVLTDKGRLITPQGAENFKGMKSTREIDTGTEKITINAQTGQEIGRRPYNAEERAAATARGRAVGGAEGTAITKLPEVESTADRLLSRLDVIENHPGMSSAVGFFAGKSPVALTPAARDFMARVDEVQSDNWTQAVQTMRGLGALSDAEGRKIDKARSRLTARDVSETDYRKAIADVKDVIQTARRNARLIATGKMKPYGGGTSEPVGSGTTSSGIQWSVE